MLILIACVCVLAGAHAQTGPSVNTTQGVIVGTYNTDGYMSFHGIPYAGSTSGENRFKGPTPPPDFPGEFHAIDDTITCAQPTSRGIFGVEDCLVLSIHTNSLNTSKPVLVWIDGENFETTGRNTHSYTKLLNEDLVVVSINYRLSIFGFLCLNIEEAPGNAGLKDIVQGLKWIRENIAGFGGDPSNIVLLGHGSGAVMADLVTLSPMANGLVHKAIVISGSAISPWAVSYNPIGYAVSFAETLGYSKQTREELAELFSTTNINVLGNALKDFKFYDNSMLFAPCIEDINLNPDDTFLSDAPIHLLQSGNYSHIPYIAAYSDKEGTIRAEEAVFQGWLDLMQRNFSDFVQADLAFEAEENKTAVANIIREQYFGQNAINMTTIDNYFNYHGDTMITVSTIRGARERALTSTAPVRLMEFAYLGTDNSFWAFPDIQLTGARHGSLLNYIFDFGLEYFGNQAQDIIISRFAYFAHTGSQRQNLTTWDPITSSFTRTLRISGGEISLNFTYVQEEARGDMDPERTAFWNSIYASYYVPPRPIYSSATSVLSFTFIVLISQLLVMSF